MGRVPDRVVRAEAAVRVVETARRNFDEFEADAQGDAVLKEAARIAGAKVERREKQVRAELDKARAAWRRGEV